jgi:nicotinamidase/pyrazinamidase
MNALLLIDIQNDFLPGGALPVPDGNKVIPFADRLQAAFDLIVATQDWHPADHGSFAASHPGRALYERIHLNGLPQILWPVHCVQHTPGADFPTELDRKRWARIFTKGEDPGIDSYSGFFDNAHRRDTGLAAYLRERGVTAVYICGLATDYCVKFTALDSVQLGFETYVIEDACRGVDNPPGSVEHALEEMRTASVKLITTAQALAKVEGIQ